ncbi:MAG: hypothetical protein A2051_08135 [Desulfovibrionales bacterium GWA2_65_9]|nr:MAG: hypothetical protein A2051_08135 [Desulfovibrionales bacterium GWA2_65_9]
MSFDKFGQGQGLILVAGCQGACGRGGLRMGGGLFGIQPGLDSARPAIRRFRLVCTQSACFHGVTILWVHVSSRRAPVPGHCLLRLESLGCITAASAPGK